MKLLKTFSSLSPLWAALLAFQGSASAQTEWKFNNSYGR